MAHVIVIGAGVIGSHVLPHVARMPGVTAISVVDRDRYDESNIRSQNITPADVGKSKAKVQVRRLRQLNQSIVATAVHRAVEDLPLGWLRADVILACLDSRRARMVVNQAAWRLGVPWINAGVDAAGLLARVQVFLPSAEAACMECAWDASDYALVDQAYPCQGDAILSPTAAPSSLGALAASLQAIECEKLLSGRTDELLAGRDVLVDARHHRHYVTSFRRDPNCLMPDHDGWRITPHAANPASMTLNGLLAESRTLPDADEGIRLSVAGQVFAGALTCVGCDSRRPVARVHREWPRSLSRCGTCQGSMTAAGFDLHDTVDAAFFPEAARRRPLRALGLMAGDIVTMATASVETHVELGRRHV